MEVNRMSSAIVPSSSLYFPSNTRFRFGFNSSNPSLISYFRPRNHKICSSISMQNLEVSWVSPERNLKDDYNGWATIEPPIRNNNKKKKGLPTFVLVGIGTSIVALLVLISQISLSRKGFEFRSQALRTFFVPSGTGKPVDTNSNGLEASPVDTVSPATPESVDDTVDETLPSEAIHDKKEDDYVGRVLVPIPIDSIQQEALLMLKKLKIVEDFVDADELCTRREYARWLARANLLLERNHKHKIVPSVALSGSSTSAFDDVSVDDPDFLYIQSLAEVGIVSSKLSLDASRIQGGANFFPERYISRQDLISWKAKLDYEVMLGINEEISRNNLGFMDVRDINSDALVVLFVDLLTGDRSITRTVFGQGKRFQPGKPCTKAQAAVALTSGRMEAAVYSELSRIEAECSSRQMAMEKIRSELLERGDIQKYWDRKIEEVKHHGAEVERSYMAAVQDLEQQNFFQQNVLAEYMKEKAAIDCQKQLLSSLKEEVDDMSERLERERARYVDEQQSIQYMRGDLQVKYDRLLETKSILGAEIEALRILRTWIEDGAKKSQARAKVLEEAGRRWKWGQQP